MNDLRQSISYRPDRNRWEIHDSQWGEVFKWCWQTFGHPGCDPDTGVKSNWDYHGGWIYFFDEKCVMMYTLRWQ